MSTFSLIKLILLSHNYRVKKDIPALSGPTLQYARCVSINPPPPPPRRPAICPIDRPRLTCLGVGDKHRFNVEFHKHRFNVLFHKDKRERASERHRNNQNACSGVRVGLFAAVRPPALGLSLFHLEHVAAGTLTDRHTSTKHSRTRDKPRPWYFHLKIITQNKRPA